MKESLGVTPSEGAAAGRLLVCERGGQWAGALRRELAPSASRSTRPAAWRNVGSALAASPASFLVVELTRASAEELLGRLARRERDFPWAEVAVVAASAWPSGSGSSARRGPSISPVRRGNWACWPSWPAATWRASPRPAAAAHRPHLGRIALGERTA